MKPMKGWFGLEWNSECHFESSMSTNTTFPILLRLYQPQWIAASFKFTLFVWKEWKSKFLCKFGETDISKLGVSTFPGKKEWGKLRRRNTKFHKWEFPRKGRMLQDPFLVEMTSTKSPDCVIVICSIKAIDEWKLRTRCGEKGHCGDRCRQSMVAWHFLGWKCVSVLLMSVKNV